MSWLKTKIHDLQNRPYPEKIKLLKRALLAAAIVLILLWIVGLQFERFQQEPANNSFSQFGSIFKNFRQLKSLPPPPTDSRQ